MKSIIAAFEWLVDTIVSLIDFIGNILGSIIEIITLMPSIINMFVGSIANLPSVLVAFATISTILAVVYFLANRQHGGSA